MTGRGLMARPRRLVVALVSTLAVGVLGAAALIGPFASPASATTADQFATVQLTTLEEVTWEPGMAVAAQVTVTTERAISGVLIVESRSEGQGATTYEFDLDLGADNTATLPLELFTGWNGVRATATLTANDQVIAVDELQAFGQGNPGTERVATLGIDNPPRRLSLTGGEGELRTFALGDRLDGLERASSLVTTPAAIAGLGPDSPQRLRVDAWVRGGGQLVVDGPRDSLDDALHRYPTANPDRYLVGAGSVVYLEDWEDGLPLGGYVGRSGLRELVESQDIGRGATGELAILAGISLPSAGTIALILLVYAVLAGPVVFGVLASQKNQRRIWWVLPGLSALFVVGILGFGLATRTGQSDTHITIVEVNEQASRATTNLLLTSATGGSRGIEAPEGWSYLGQGRRENQRPVRLRVGARTTDISIETPPGGTSVARLGGVASQFDGILTITNIGYQDGLVTAEITNNSDANLTEAQAFLGNARTEIGSVAAGETVSFEVAARDSSGRTMRELLGWPRVRREWTNRGDVAIPDDRDATTAAGSWTEWRIEQGSSAMPETTLGVVGWTDDLAGPLPGFDDGRTALFVRQTIPAEAAGSVGFTTTARMVSRHGAPEFGNNFEGYPEDYRITLIDGFNPASLAVTADRNSAAVGFLTAGGWRYATLPEQGEVTVAVPSEAVINGEVAVRSYVPPWTWGIGQTLHAVVDSDADTFDLVGEPQFRMVDGGGFGPVPDDVFMEPGFGGLPRDLDEELAVDVVFGEDQGAEEPQVFDGDVGAGAYHAYRVELAAGAELIATMSSGRGDSYLELVDADGNLVAFNDDYGRNVDSQIRFVPDQDGVYEIRAQDLGSGFITYSLSVEVLR